MGASFQFFLHNFTDIFLLLDYVKFGNSFHFWKFVEEGEPLTLTRLKFPHDTICV